MKTEEILTLFNEGFIPGPGEDEEAFLTRIRFCKSCAKMPEEILDKLPFSAQPFEKENLSFPWLIVTKSKKHLPLWELGATWTVDKQKLIPILQIKNETLSLSELIAHEEVHIRRIAFDEPKFEEIMAYRRSEKSWRRLLGPLFFRPKEAVFLLIFLFTALVIEAGGGFMFGFILPLGYLGWLVKRLVAYQKLFRAFLKILRKEVKERVDEAALLFTDQEIKISVKNQALQVPKDLRYRLFEAFSMKLGK
ncbi:MAG: hypothetical protein WDZ28_01265 [Simkaniaceae bacterium]